ncbi:MAG: hypothetical protein ACOH2J_10090 [Allorhizobium sp.]
MSAVVAIITGPAMSADCVIEKAIYAEPDSGFELRFVPAIDNSPVSHTFKILVPKADLTLDGHVLYDDNTARPIATAMLNCPDGDVTGADIAACTIWQGVVYATSAGDAIDILPPEGDKAPDELLLPGFGPAIRQSNFWSKVSKLPWDVFTLKGCQA